MNYFRILVFKLYLLQFLILLGSCQQKTQTSELKIARSILEDSSSFFYLDAKQYPENRNALPIGVFDSGTGGLTVLEAILNFDQFENETQLPKSNGDGRPDFGQESFIYLADQANMPYGNYSYANKVDLLKEHILKDAQFLLGTKYYPGTDAKNFKSDKNPVKAIVIACNTATAYGKSDIEQFISKAELDIKVIGVIDAAVRATFSKLGSEAEASIAVMATAGTVSSNGYVNSLKNEQPSGMNLDIFQQAGIGLAGAIDGSADFIAPDALLPRKEYKGPSDTNPQALIDLEILSRYDFDWHNHQMLYDGTLEKPSIIQLNSINNYIAYHLVSILEQIRTSTNRKALKAIILGCTHYPYFSETFKNTLQRLYDYQEKGVYIYRPFMAEDISLIDPAENVAQELYTYLQAVNYFNNTEASASEFYISVPNSHNPNIQIDSLFHFPYDYKYGRTAGQIQQYVKRVPFSEQTISPVVAKRLEKSVPSSFRLIKSFYDQNSNNE